MIIDQNEGIHNDTTRNDNTHYSHIQDLKGKIAEALIAEMFEELGFTVYRTGMENVLPGFSKKGELKRKGKAAEIMRKIPDLLIVRKNIAYFIEVKFRNKGKYGNYSNDKKDLLEDYPYPDAYFVIVSKEYMQGLKASKLIEDVKSNESNFFEVTTGLDFLNDNGDREIVNKYRQLCKNVFRWVEK